MKKIRIVAIVACLVVALVTAVPSVAQVMEIKTNETFFKPGPAGNAIINADSGTASDDFAELRLRQNGTNKWSFGVFQNAYYAFNYQNSQYGMRIDATNNVGLNCFSGADDLTIGSGSNGCKAGTFSTINAGATQFTASSSRTIKENLEPVEIDGLLEKIGEAKIYTYDFIEGDKDAIGLMAEDFHQIFGRGSDKMLSGHEVQVALWLAVQELAEQNRELTEQNRELSQRLDTLEQR